MGEIFADRCCNGNVSGCFIVYLQLNFIGNKSPVVLLGGIVFDRNRGFLIFSQGRRTDTYRQMGMFTDYLKSGGFIFTIDHLYLPFQYLVVIDRPQIDRVAR